MNKDNDDSEIVLSHTLNSLDRETEENGKTGKFLLSLKARPMLGTQVKIDLRFDDSSEGEVVSPKSVIFNGDDPNQWKTPQIITVKGVDDSVIDRVQSYNYRAQINRSETNDANFKQAPDKTITFKNYDDENDFIFTDAGKTGILNEGNSNSLTYTFAVNSRPSSDIAVTLTLTDGSEARFDPETTKTLVFNEANWKSQQSVRVFVVDDTIRDGTISSQMRTQVSTQDSGYGALSLPNYSIQTTDDDPGLVSVTTNLIETSESDASSAPLQKLQFFLNGTPNHPVSLDIALDTTEGIVSSNLPSFQANIDHSENIVLFELTGVDDDILDGNQYYNVVVIAKSQDPLFNGEQAIFSLLNYDNEADFIQEISNNRQIVEGTDQKVIFKYKLNTKPVKPVVLSLESTDLTEASFGGAASIDLVFLQ